VDDFEAFFRSRDRHKVKPSEGGIFEVDADRVVALSV
jgi:hypothetical protein